MNLNFGRRDRLNQEMASSLPASLFLLSVVFWQFVSAAGQNNMPVKATVGENVILPCKAPDPGQIRVAEWSRTDLGPKFVLLYRNFQLDLENQDPSYRDRVDLLIGQINKGDVSLVLKNTKTADRGTYECHVVQTDLTKKLISTVSLVVAPPEPFPVWAIVLPVLLGLALVAAAAAAALYYLFHWSPVQQVKVESGKESVKLPLKVPRCLWFCRYRNFLHVAKVEWKDGDNRKVHVYPNGSDQPGEQHLIYKNRTKMDENLLENGDFSLTLERPRDEDDNIFTCSVYNRKGEKLKKDVWLKVKVPKVEVRSGKESVELHWRTTECLDGAVKVEWKDRENRTVHVYQNCSDQPGEQNEIYKDRTKMDKNLSLTLLRPIESDRGIYTCRVYNKDRVMLMMKQVNLQVKVQQVEVESGMESVLLPWEITESLDGAVKVEWKDGENRTVHVYQNGSDQPGEQDQTYKDRTRTKMDENLLENKDLSLTLLRPKESDFGTFTCRVSSRDGNMLKMKQVNLKAKGSIQVQPDDTRTGSNSVDQPLMAGQPV